jgi:hypothetical protein
MRKIQKDDDYYGPPSESTQYQGIGDPAVVALVAEQGHREPVYAVIDQATGRPILVFPMRVTGKDTGLVECWMEGYGASTMKQSYIEMCRYRPTLKMDYAMKQAIIKSVQTFQAMHPVDLISVPGDNPVYQKARNGG